MPRKSKVPHPYIKSFKTSVAGVTKDGRQKIIKKYCKIGNSVQLVPEPNNPYDRNAIKVVLQNGYDIGYLSAEVAEIANRKSKKNGANQLAYIHDIGLCGELNNIYYVTLNMIEYNNYVTPEDVDIFYQKEYQFSMQGNAPDIVIDVAKKRQGIKFKVIFKKAAELTFKGSAKLWHLSKVISVKLWHLSKVGFKFSLKKMSAAWEVFINSN